MTGPYVYASVPFLRQSHFPVQKNGANSMSMKQCGKYSDILKRSVKMSILCRISLVIVSPLVMLCLMLEQSMFSKTD